MTIRKRSARSYARTVHRDPYLDHKLFELEMEHLWRNTWVYGGHDSRVPNPAGTTTQRGSVGKGTGFETSEAS